MRERIFAAYIYVTETEHDAVMRMYDWKETVFDGDDQLYYEAETEKNGHSVRIAAAQQDEMGMTASATLTTKMIHLFVPEYVIMPGIAAGTKNILGSDAQEFGDVLLANAVWNYSNGKYVSPNEAEIVFGEIGFNPRPTMVKITGDHLTQIQKYLQSKQSEFYVHSGPLASGTAVVANESLIKKQIYGSFEDTEGVEMEGYGVAYAVSHALSPKPHTIIAKSVCDFADERKNDIYQKFAAYTSCGFVKDLLEKVLDYHGI
jgi:nucleoside phosphorylase